MKEHVMIAVSCGIVGVIIAGIILYLVQKHKNRHPSDHPKLGTYDNLVSRRYMECPSANSVLQTSFDLEQDRFALHT